MGVPISIEGRGEEEEETDGGDCETGALLVVVEA